MKLVSWSLLATFALLASCNKGASKPKEDDPSTNPDDAAKPGTVAIAADNQLAVAYPAGLNVTAFPTEQIDPAKVGTIGVDTGAAKLALTQTQQPATNTQGGATCDRAYQTDDQGNITATGTGSAQINPLDPCTATTNQPQPAPQGGATPFDKNGVQKAEAEQELLSGKAANCLSDDALAALMFKPNESEACYQFDYGVMKGESCTSKEACLVAYSRQVIGGGVGKVEGALGVMQALLCQAKKDGKEQPPEAGATIDLTESLKKAAEGRTNAPTITAAKITRLDVGGKATYKSTLAMTMQDGGTFEFNIAHTPSTTDSSYEGVMWISRTMGTQQQGGVQPGPNGQVGPAVGPPVNPPTLALQADANKVEALSVRYARSGTGAATKVKMQVRSASLDKSLTAFTTGGEVNLPADATLDNSKLGAIDYYAFDVNPETSEGSLAFWRNPGANITEPARGFVFDVSYDKTTGALAGCGVAGADVDKYGGVGSIRSALAAGKTLKPVGLYTPQMCQVGQGGANDNVADKVWKQCFKQNAQGVYEVDPSKTADTRGFEFLQAVSAGVTAPEIAFATSMDGVNK